MATLPKWATPQRRAYLIELFEKCGGFCVYGHRPCPHPEHHFENHIEVTIEYWKQDDREERAEQIRMERELLHAMPDESGWGRRFDPVAREQFFDRQPQYYVEALGISGSTFNPIAQVRIPSTNQRLFVDVPKPDLHRLSKHQRRKAKRYHKETVDCNCAQAVQDYWETL